MGKGSKLAGLARPPERRPRRATPRPGALIGYAEEPSDRGVLFLDGPPPGERGRDVLTVMWFRTQGPGEPPDLDPFGPDDHVVIEDNLKRNPARLAKAMRRLEFWKKRGFRPLPQSPFVTRASMRREWEQQ